MGGAIAYKLWGHYLDSYLKIVDNMSDETIKNMVKSISENVISLMMKMMRVSIIQCKGYSHCQKAIYESNVWTDMVENFITN